MKIIELEQRSPEWMAWRLEHLGASDAPVLMGVSKHRTLRKLYNEKQGTWTCKDNPYMERGRILEGTALEVFSESHPGDWKPMVVEHSSYQWAGASLDGWNGECIVEIKCPGPKAHEIALKGEVPSNYYPQLQWQMECTGTDHAWYYSFDGFEGVAIEVKKDPQYVDILFKRGEEFYRRCMEGHENYKDLKW